MNSHIDIIERAEKFVKEQLQNDPSGHDWWHIHRVRVMALRMAKKEGGNEFICELASLLHDVADEKLNLSKEAGMNKVMDWLNEYVTDIEIREQVLLIISTMSYNGGHNPPMNTIEGQIVQDADRLDALGAIGIARTFAYGGSKGRLMHIPESTPRGVMSQEEYRSSEGTAIHHFYEKLFKLKDLMNTEYGKLIARQRHEYMKEYVEQFYAEWDAKDDAWNGEQQ
ncbi:HD domain-containing protein [Paenibacillus sp. IHBB 10380]|uniref:HD domain-containing protein n=1 Tax=Paenibacillus sp. IHBB 10380 TaxID=1566358 RepID=UPI0005CF97BF|nr:HD domain-containing protein [Paenibacillus sp. IHBB 10380]AJS59341.1 phosphohydrolase [Paenibacillus sp. IHBB 10380]